MATSLPFCACCSYVLDGERAPALFDKITSRIRKLGYELSEHVDPVRRLFYSDSNPIHYLLFQALVSQKVINGFFSGVTTVQLDQLAAETAASMTTLHPDYAILAARIAVSNLHKQTTKKFSGGFPILRLTS